MAIGTASAEARQPTESRRKKKKPLHPQRL
jgi:hypothetical protein